MVGITKVEVNKIVDFNFFFTLKRYCRYLRYLETKKEDTFQRPLLSSGDRI